MNDRNRPPRPSHWPDEENSVGTCLVCGRYIDYEVGVMLDMSPTPIVCIECWAKLSPAEKLDQIRQWRVAESQMQCFEAVKRLCEGAIDGYHLPRGDLGEAGQN